MKINNPTWGECDYEGETKDGLAFGRGKLTSEYGHTFYVGDWIDNLESGFGK